MPISVVCPTCGTKLRAPGASAGKRLKCPKCSEIVAVPGASVQTHATPVAKAEESAPRPAVRPTSPQSQSALTCPTCRTQIRPDPGATSAYCPQCWELVALPSTPTVQPVARPKKRKPLPSWLLPVGCPAVILGLALAFVGMGGCPARRQAADPLSIVLPSNTAYRIDQAAPAGAAEIRITSVALEPDLFADPASANPKDKHLSVKLRVTNTAKAKRWRFGGWSSFENSPELGDDVGNNSSAQAFGGDSGSGDLYPGQSADCKVR
jgi:hypothetical protein